jgi:hypothetical protein
MGTDFWYADTEELPPFPGTVVSRQQPYSLICVKGAQVDRTEPRAMAGGTDWIAIACYAPLIAAATLIVALVVLAF